MKDLMDTIYQSTEIIELKFDESDVGSFSGYASVFGNVDKGKDICVKGCFSDSIKSAGSGDNPAAPLMLWMHDQKEPIGEWKMLQEDDKGLFVQGKLWTGKGIVRAEQAYSLLKSGQGGLSVGYIPQKAVYDEKKAVRSLHKVELKEVSVVTLPMNMKARVVQVKAVHATAVDMHTTDTAKKAAAFASQMSDHANSLTDAAMTSNDFGVVHEAAMAHSIARDAHSGLGYVSAGPATALHQQQADFHRQTGYRLQDRMSGLGNIEGCKWFEEPVEKKDVQAVAVHLSSLFKQDILEKKLSQISLEMKFNPNHDEQGRFAEGDSSGGGPNIDVPRNDSASRATDKAENASRSARSGDKKAHETASKRHAEAAAMHSHLAKTVTRDADRKFHESMAATHNAKAQAHSDKAGASSTPQRQSVYDTMTPKQRARMASRDREQSDAISRQNSEALLRGESVSRRLR